MANDLEIALGLANHIISPCSHPQEEHQHLNLRQHHIRLAAETLAVMQDNFAKDYLGSIINIYK